MNYKVKPVIKKVKPASKKLTITLKKKVAGATGYQIQYAKNSKFSSAKAVTSKKLTKAISKLSSKTTYYVRVRAYNTVNGKKAYGSWSKVSKGTAK